MQRYNLPVILQEKAHISSETLSFLDLCQFDRPRHPPLCRPPAVAEKLSIPSLRHVLALHYLYR